MIKNSKWSATSISNRIENIRFPLCIGVMLIHCNILGMEDSENVGGVIETIVTFGSKTLPMLCVPMFFMISGYISAFRKIDSHNYLEFMRKKFRSLILPFLAWNLLTFLLRLLIRISPLGNFCTTPYAFDNPLTLLINIFIRPELFPLWFIRNLILLNIILPLLQIALRKSMWLTLLFALIINDCVSPLGGIFYFSLGIAIGQNKSTQIFKINKTIAISGVLLYLTTAFLLALHPYSFLDNAIFIMPAILIGCLSVFALVSCGSPRSRNSLLSPPGIFFLYAFHGIIAPYVIKAVLILLRGHYGIATYLLTCLLVIGGSMVSWYVLSALFPKCMNILTGDRKPKNIAPL